MAIRDSYAAMTLRSSSACHLTGFSGGSAEAAAADSISASACFARQMREESDQISHTKRAIIM